MQGIWLWVVCFEADIAPFLFTVSHASSDSEASDDESFHNIQGKSTLFSLCYFKMSTWIFMVATPESFSNT